MARSADRTGRPERPGWADVLPDFTGELHTRLEAYVAPEAVRPPNLHDAQRAVRL
ncbi:hypothetical protein ACF1BU_31925 [Streptomyces sp. NPDC014724]|uniref:hypothetical protein n=1 Tax=unclassified Streptomyces TaxID=2593676 RepID=UPI003700876A